MSDTMSLTDVENRLAEVVSRVRTTGESVVITVDGVAAAEIMPVMAEPRRLTPNDIATIEALEEALLHMPRAPGAFDAVELIRDGRR